MKRRRWLRRLAWLFGIFLVLFIAFALALYNPLESDLDDLDAMVPMEFGNRNVTFVVRAPSLDALKSRAFLSDRIRTSPFWTDLERSYDLDQYLYGQLEEIERQVQSRIGGIADFSIAEDVFGREILMAGDIDVEDMTGSPYLFLTRVSWKVKAFLELLHYEAVRDKIQRPGELTIREKRFWFELEVEKREWKRNQDERLTFYVARARDVLAVSNDLELMEQAVFLAESQGKESIRVKHAGYRDSLPYQKGGSEPSTWFDILELNEATAGAEGLADVLEPDPGEPRGLEDLFFELIPPRYQYDASFSLDLADPDRLTADILIAREDTRPVPEHLESFYRGEFFLARDVLESIGRIAPVDRTIGLAALAMEPVDFLRVMHLYQTPARQELVAEELLKGGLTPKALASDLGSYLRAPVGILLTRMNEKVDGLPLDDLDDGLGTNTQAALHLTMRFTNAGNAPRFIEDAIRANAGGLGLTVRPREILDDLPDVEYYPMPLEGVARDETGFVDPALAVQGDRLYFSTNGGELLRLLRAARGGSPVLADDDAARDLIDESEEEGLLVYLNGPVFRKYLLDQRHEKAYRAMEQIVDDDRIQMREKTRLVREVMPDAEYSAEAREARERAFLAWKEQTSKVEFAKALKAWRQTVKNFEPVTAILLAFRPGTEETEGRLVIECR